MEPLSTDICADKLDRRTGRDRRQRRWPTLKSLFANRRRRSVRRKMDRRRLVILDYYHPPLMISILLILVLSIADAVLTLFLLDHGAVELNDGLFYPARKRYVHLSEIFVYCSFGFNCRSVELHLDPPSQHFYSESTPFFCRGVRFGDCLGTFSYLPVCLLTRNEMLR